MIYSGICLIVDGLFDIFSLFYIRGVIRSFKDEVAGPEIMDAHVED